MPLYADHHHSKYGAGSTHKLDVRHKFADCVTKYPMLSYASYENEWDPGCKQQIGHGEIHNEVIGWSPHLLISENRQHNLRE